MHGVGEIGPALGFVVASQKELIPPHPTTRSPRRLGLARA